MAWNDNLVVFILLSCKQLCLKVQVVVRVFVRTHSRPTKLLMQNVWIVQITPKTFGDGIFMYVIRFKYGVYFGSQSF